MIYLYNNSNDEILSTFFVYTGTPTSISPEYVTQKIDKGYIGTYSFGNLVTYDKDKTFRKIFNIPVQYGFKGDDKKYIQEYQIGTLIAGFKKENDNNVLTYYGYTDNELSDVFEASLINVGDILDKYLHGYTQNTSLYEVFKLGIAEPVVNQIKSLGNKYKDTDFYRASVQSKYINYPQISPMPQILIAIMEMQPQTGLLNGSDDFFLEEDREDRTVLIPVSDDASDDYAWALIVDDVYSSSDETISIKISYGTKAKNVFDSINGTGLYKGSYSGLQLMVYVPEYLFPAYNGGLEITFLNRTFRCTSFLKNNNTVEKLTDGNCEIIENVKISKTQPYSGFKIQIDSIDAGIIDAIENKNETVGYITIKRLAPTGILYSSEQFTNQSSVVGPNIIKVESDDVESDDAKTASDKLYEMSYNVTGSLKMPYIANRLIGGDDNSEWYLLEKGLTRTNIDNLSLAKFSNLHPRQYTGLGSNFFNIMDENSNVHNVHIAEINSKKIYQTQGGITLNIKSTVLDTDNLYVPEIGYFNEKFKILNINEITYDQTNLKNIAISDNLSQIKFPDIEKQITNPIDLISKSNNAFQRSEFFDNDASSYTVLYSLHNVLLFMITSEETPSQATLQKLIKPYKYISDNFKVFQIQVDGRDLQNYYGDNDTYNLGNPTMIINPNDIKLPWIPKGLKILSKKHFLEDSGFLSMLDSGYLIEDDIASKLSASKLSAAIIPTDDTSAQNNRCFIYNLNDANKSSLDINALIANTGEAGNIIDITFVNDAFSDNYNYNGTDLKNLKQVIFPNKYFPINVGNNVLPRDIYKQLTTIKAHPEQIYKFFIEDQHEHLLPTDNITNISLYQSSSLEKYTMFSDISDYLEMVSPKLIDLNISLDYLNFTGELKLDIIKNLTIRGYGDSTANQQYVPVNNIECGYNLRNLTVENFSETNVIYETGSTLLKMSDTLSIPTIEPYVYLYNVNLDEDIHLEYAELGADGDEINLIERLPALCQDFENIKEYVGSFLYRIAYAKYKHNGEGNAEYYINKFIVTLPKSSETILTNVNPYTRNDNTTPAKRSWRALNNGTISSTVISSNGFLNAEQLSSIESKAIYSIPGLLDTRQPDGQQKPTYNSSVPFTKLKIYPSKETDVVSTYNGTTSYSYATYNILPVLSNQTYTAYKHGIKYPNRAYYLKELDISGVKFLDSMLNQAFSLEKLTYDPYNCVLSYDKELLATQDGLRHRTIFTPYMKTTVEWKRVPGRMYQMVDYSHHIGSQDKDYVTIDKYYPITDFPATVGATQEPFISEYVSAFDGGYYGDKNNGTGFWEYQDCDNANRRSIFNIFIKYRYVSMHINSSYTYRYRPEDFTTDDIVLMAVGFNSTSPSLINNVTLTINSVGYNKKIEEGLSKELYDRMVYVIGTPLDTSFNNRDIISLYLNGYNLLGYSFTGYDDKDNTVAKFEPTISKGLNILSARPQGYAIGLADHDTYTYNANYSIPISTYGVTQSKQGYGYNPVILGSFSGNLLKFRIDDDDDPSTKVEETIFYSCIEDEIAENKYTMDAYLEVRLLPKTLKELHIKISKDDIINNTYNGIEVDNVIYPVKNSTTISLPEFNIYHRIYDTSVEIYDTIYNIEGDYSERYVIICGNKYVAYNNSHYFTIPAQNNLPIINRIKIYTDEQKQTLVEYFGENDTISVGWYDYNIVNGKVNVLGTEYDVDRITIVNGIDSNINKSLNIEGLINYTWYDNHIDVRGAQSFSVKTNIYLKSYTIDAVKIYGVYYPVKRVVTIENEEYTVSGLMSLGEEYGGIVLYNGNDYDVYNTVDVDSYFELEGSFGSYKVIIDGVGYPVTIYAGYTSTDYRVYGWIYVRSDSNHTVNDNTGYVVEIRGNNTTSPFVTITIRIRETPGERDTYSIYIGNVIIKKITDNFRGAITYVGLDGYYKTCYVYGVVNIAGVKYKVKNSYIFNNEEDVINGYDASIGSYGYANTYSISDGAVIIDGIKHYIDRSVENTGYDTRRCDVIANEVIVGGDAISVETVYTDPDSKDLYTYAYATNGIIYKVKSTVTFGDKDINVVYKADGTIAMGGYTYKLYSRKLIYDGKECPIKHYIKINGDDLEVNVDNFSQEPNGTVEIDSTTYNVFFLDGIITYNGTDYPVIDGHVQIGNVEYLAINNVVIIGGYRWPAFKDNSDSYTYQAFDLFGRKYSVEEFTSHEHVLTENPIFYAKHDSLEHVYIEGCAFNGDIPVCGTNNLNIQSNALLKNNSDLKKTITELIKSHSESYGEGFFTSYEQEIDYTDILKSYIIVHVDVNVDAELFNVFTKDGWFGYPGRVLLDPKTGLPPMSSTRDQYKVYNSFDFIEIYAVGLEIRNVNTDVKQNYIEYTAYKRYYNKATMPPNYPEHNWYYNEWTSGSIPVDDLLDPVKIYPDEIS